MRCPFFQFNLPDLLLHILILFYIKLKLERVHDISEFLQANYPLHHIALHLVAVAAAAVVVVNTKYDLILLDVGRNML